jgi:type I restriction enzyme S subunit
MLNRRIQFNEENIPTYKLAEVGDFVISLRSFQGGLEYSNYRGLVSPAYHVIRPKIEVSRDFYRHYFKSPEFIKRLAVAVIGIRDGKQISYSDFSFMRIPLPSLKEQTKIAETLDIAGEEIVLLEKQLTLFKLQKKGLMQQLLTGKKQVKVAETT